MTNFRLFQTESFADDKFNVMKMVESSPNGQKTPWEMI